MKDYSNYHGLTMQQKLMNDGKKMFQAQLDSEGSDATIDGTVCRVLVHRTSNPINEDKEERKIMCLDNITINRGSIVIIDSKTYLVISDITTNQVYKKGKMVEVNYVLKLRADDGVVYEIPSFLRNNSVTTVGINDIKVVNLPDGKLWAQLPKTDITTQITRNKYNRFVVDGIAWKVVYVDKFTQNGVVKLLLVEEMIDTKQDDIMNNIADDAKYQYAVEILNGSTVNLGFGQSLQLMVRVYQNDVILDNPAVVYSTSNPTLVTVTDTGLITPIQAGNHIVTVTYKNASANIVIRAGSTPKYNYYANITGQHTIKIGEQALYTVKFMNNSDEIYYPAVWSLTAADGISPTSLVSIIGLDVDNGTCFLKTNDNFDKGTFWLWVKNADNTIVAHLEIHVIARF